MKRTLQLTLLLAIAAIGRCLAQLPGEAPYTTDTFGSANQSAQQWQTNGQVSEGSSGLQITSTTGASMISTVTIPDGSTQYRVGIIMPPNYELTTGVTY